VYFPIDRVIRFITNRKSACQLTFIILTHCIKIDHVLIYICKRLRLTVVGKVHYFCVSVPLVISDIHAPVLKCTPSITRYVEPGRTSLHVYWAEPEVEDNSRNPHVVQLSGPEPGSLLGLGGHVVEYRAADETGNVSPLCTMIVHVEGILYTKVCS